MQACRKVAGRRMEAIKSGREHREVYNIRELKLKRSFWRRCIGVKEASAHLRVTKPLADWSQRDRDFEALIACTITEVLTQEN